MNAFRIRSGSRSAGALKDTLVQRVSRLCEKVIAGARRLDILDGAQGKYRYWRNRQSLASIIGSERILLRRVRQEHDEMYKEQKQNPLVSVVIPTWNRGELLVSRTLPSVLNQTYRNLEILIVGDHCTDNTGSLLSRIDDPRLNYHNLPERGRYHTEQKALWQVAGSAPKNKGLELARGEWIAPLDDDDVFTPDHIESLLRFAQTHNLELVYGTLRIEETTGRWKEKGQVNHQMSIQNSTMLFRSYLKLFRSDINAWRYGLTADYQRTIRYRETGVRIGYLNKVVALMPLRPGQTRIGLSAEDRPGTTAVQRTAELSGP